MRWLDLVWALPVMIGLGAGCGNTVTDEPTNSGGSGAHTSNGGGGSGATGGSCRTTAPTSTTMTTTTPSTTTTTTSSTVTGDACAVACAEAGMCGLPADTCAMYLSCDMAQGQCAADCINQPDI